MSDSTAPLRPSSAEARAHRTPKALFRIGERHAATPEMRHRHEHSSIAYPFEAVRVVELLAAGSAMYQDGEEPVDSGDFVAALTLVPVVRDELEQSEANLIAMARGRGMTWNDIAEALGLASAQAAQQRYARLVARQGDASGA